MCQVRWTTTLQSLSARRGLVSRTVCRRTTRPLRSYTRPREPCHTRATERGSAVIRCSTRRLIAPVNRQALSTTISPRRSETLGSGSRLNRKDLLPRLRGLRSLDDEDDDDDDLTRVKYTLITRQRWLHPGGAGEPVPHLFRIWPFQ